MMGIHELMIKEIKIFPSEAIVTCCFGFSVTSGRTSYTHNYIHVCVKLGQSLYRAGFHTDYLIIVTLLISIMYLMVWVVALEHIAAELLVKLLIRLRCLRPSENFLTPTQRVYTAEDFNSYLIISTDLIPEDFIGEDKIKYRFSTNLTAKGEGFYLITMFNLFTGLYS